MEKIFSCSLPVNGNNTEYHVVFQDEKYTFTPNDNHSGASSFNIVREEDEWKSVDNIDSELSKQAIAKLEEYLLSQH